MSVHDPPSPGNPLGGSVATDDEAMARLLAQQERILFSFASVDEAALGGGAMSEAGDEMDDEAFARALQEGEEREFQARLRALAGANAALSPDASTRSPGEDGGGLEVADEADAEVEDADDDLDTDHMTYEDLVALGESVGGHVCGLSAEQIERLPREAFVPDQDKAEEEQCTVCRVEFDAGEMLTVLPKCGHRYHSDCLAQWLKQSKLCAICKQDVL
mmetsp:Transcript_22960/g.74809  ORF Transcript_22960/g.74809 Transcript_22960/m.74809 type:complete len:218 (+) Transcript_22960:13-666(+)